MTAVRSPPPWPGKRRRSCCRSGQGARRPAVQPTRARARTEGAEPGGPATAIRSLRNPPRPGSPVRAQGSPVRRFRRTTRGIVARHLGLAADEKKTAGILARRHGQRRTVATGRGQLRPTPNPGVPPPRPGRLPRRAHRADTPPRPGPKPSAPTASPSTGRHSYLNGLSIRDRRRLPAGARASRRNPARRVHPATHRQHTPSWPAAARARETPSVVTSTV